MILINFAIIYLIFTLPLLINTQEENVRRLFRQIQETTENPMKSTLTALIIPDCSKNAQITSSIMGTIADSFSVTPSGIQEIAIPFYGLRAASEVFDAAICAEQAELRNGGIFN